MNELITQCNVDIVEDITITRELAYDIILFAYRVNNYSNPFRWVIDKFLSDYFPEADISTDADIKDLVLPRITNEQLETLLLKIQ